MEPSVITYPLPQTRLYSIAGIMDTFIGSLEEVKQANFGGYFSQGEDQTIKGQLIDPHGSATIEGTLTSDKLEFVKKYENGPSVEADIQYHYQKSANGIWIGTYDFKLGEKKATGNSTCQVTLVILEQTTEETQS
ncbi:MAG TPA: hypothetical protein PLD54_01585 [Candidatus Levybacteria bacterium]|nr:hypothetical protein [Candidatus Levybacteria bacterium]